ncbi:MAG TPA: response regulator [Thermomicrobiales bacterium]|nr:response regulator [Thermomicrobiales bacterium]
MGTLKILVVEDEPIIRDLIVDFLTGEGFEPIAVADGGQAVALATQERPDLILLDMMLPAVDGASVLRLLRDNPRTRSIRVIAMSADERQLRVARSLKVSEVLPKPFNLLDLLDLIAAPAVSPAESR